jgi:hypothetical protein
VAASLLLAAGVLAQAGPLTCDGRNHQSSNATAWVLGAGDTIAVLYVPATDQPVEHIDWFFPQIPPSPTGPIQINIGRGTIGVRPYNPALPGPPALHYGEGIFNGTSATVIPGVWQGADLPARLILVAGIPVWLTYTRAPYTGTATIGTETGGPDPTPYTVLSGGVWGPLQTSLAFKLRLGDATCLTNAQPATAVPVGFGCPGSGGLAPLLSGLGLPRLGNLTFAAQVTGAGSSLPIHFFWSPQPDAIGTPLGGTCLLYLDLAGLVAGIQAGLNPIFSTTTDAAGNATLPLPIGPAAVLANVSFALQAVILDPLGQPTSIPGVGIALSNALDLHVGL